MLILSRKLNERFVCVLPDGQEIWISVVDCNNNRCRIGIEAPDNVSIAREELLAMGDTRHD